MGQEFCKGCQDCSEFKKFENDFSNFVRPIQNVNNPLINQNTNTISAVNEGGLINDTSFSVSANYNHKQQDNSTIKSPLNNNNCFDKEDDSYIQKNEDDNAINNNKKKNKMNLGQNLDNNYNEKEDQQKIKNRNVNLIIKYWRKLKAKRNKEHQIIGKKDFFLSGSQYYLNYNENKELDVDLAPDQNCLYIGTFLNDKKDGFGLELFSDSKAKYSGMFSYGKRVHLGRFINTNLYDYYGEIKGLYAEGYGCHKNYKDGSSYEGMWKNSKKEGLGIEYYKDNSVYRGYFSKGKKHGIGSYEWTDNSSYKGEWNYNNLEGYGIYKFKDGSIYKGHWKANRMDGLGEFTFPQLKTYIGFFQRDKRAGFGILLWYKENKTFVGFWSDNKQNGYGKFIVDKKIRYGYWKDGAIKQKFENENEIISKLNDEEKNYLAYFKLSDYHEICNSVKKILV